MGNTQEEVKKTIEEAVKTKIHIVVALSYRTIFLKSNLFHEVDLKKTYS